MINKENNTIVTKEDVTIAYKGNVTIKKINSITGKVVSQSQKHNTGRVPFFDLIVKCIARIDETAGMPQYLKGFNGVTPTISSFISYNNPIIIKDTSSSSVRFDFLIPFTQISRNLSTTSLRLYSVASDSAEVFAEVDVTSENFIGDGQTNYLISWTITIGNASIAI